MSFKRGPQHEDDDLDEQQKRRINRMEAFDGDDYSDSDDEAEAAPSADQEGEVEEDVAGDEDDEEDMDAAEGAASMRARARRGYQSESEEEIDAEDDEDEEEAEDVESDFHGVSSRDRESLEKYLEAEQEGFGALQSLQQELGFKRFKAIRELAQGKKPAQKQETSRAKRRHPEKDIPKRKRAKNQYV